MTKKMMKQKIRKQELINKSKGSSFGAIDISSVEIISQIIEEEENSSENRFYLIASPEAVQTFSKATLEFQSKHRLKVIVTKLAKEIPDIPQNTRFKYSHTGGRGTLNACSTRIEEGKDLTITLAWKDDLLIGYGIATTDNGECEIEIIDVDSFSRRRAGLAEMLQISGQSFQIGVGHVVVNSLLGKCSRPIHVDATQSSSRYIFKSLGFIHDSKSSKPFILKLN
jgi:hypothetical protein